MKKGLFWLALILFITVIIPQNALALDYYNTYPEFVYYWDGTTYIAETGDAQTPTLGDIYLGQESGIGATTLYISMGERDFIYTYFDALYINVSTPGVYGEVAWEYHGEGGWKSLDVVDETENFTVSGWHEVFWDMPADFLNTAVNGKIGLWVRARTTKDYGELPLGSQIEVRAYNLKLKVEDSAGDPIAGLDESNFSLDQCSDPKLYGLRELGDGVYELALSTRDGDRDCMLSVTKFGWTSSPAKPTGEMTNYLTDLTPEPFVLSQDLEISASASTVAAVPVIVAPNGVEESTITVTIKNSGGEPLSDRVVDIISSRGTDDTISTVQATTNIDGKATFKIKSSKAGQSTITATCEGITIEQRATVDFTTLDVDFGSLIKITDDGNPATTHDTAVYYYASDGKRYVFPNEKVYFSWYDDFSDVAEISSGLMASIPLGKNVTYRPGTWMVKIQSDPKTYAVAQGGVLRWIKTEQLAVELYGADWNKKIHDIDVAFWPNYTFGDDIDDSSDFNPQTEMENIRTINQNLGL